MEVANEFPLMLMRELSVDWNIFAATATPGQTGSGAFPSSRLDGGGLWVGKLNQILIMSEDAMRAYRALRIAADNGAAALIVPRHDILQPWPVVGGQTITSYGDVPWENDDGADVLFGDDAGWSQPVILAETVGEAELRSTSLTIRFAFGGPLRGGECFSIEHPTMDWRLYEIKSIELDDLGYSKVTFRPPLREDVAHATAIEFDQPRCRMKLFAPDSMNVSLETFPFTRPTAQFIETDLSP